MAHESGRFAAITPEQTSAVRSMTDLAVLVEQMREDLLGSGAREWENATLDRFLKALAAVAEDRAFEGTPTWADVAELLVTATGYE